jgi:hypothetical protein
MKTELREKMMDVAFAHIDKVQANPDIELEDVDAYDAWIRFDKDWELNVHEANFGFTSFINAPQASTKERQDETSAFEWYCCAYPVRMGEDGYEHIITEEGEHLFKYHKKERIT